MKVLKEVFKQNQSCFYYPFAKFNSREILLISLFAKLNSREIEKKTTDFHSQIREILLA